MQSLRVLCSLLALSGSMSLAQADSATLTHRYEFNGNVTDSIGSLNATATQNWAPSKSLAPVYSVNSPAGSVGPVNSAGLSLGTSDSFSGFTVPGGAIAASGSISLWFQHDLDKAGAVEGNYILSMNSTWNRGIKLYFGKDSSNLILRVGDQTINLSGGISKDVWYHAAITWDTGSNTASFYINGTEVDTITFTAGTIGSGGMNVGNYDFQTTRSTLLSTQFHGSVYDMQFYSGTLSEQEISFMAANPGSINIPEPSSALILLGAAAGIVALRRRKKAA